jgi:hypothetical protein
MAETFQEKACRHFDIPPERYGKTVLRLTLYPHARWLRLIPAHAWLAPDLTFVTAVGRLTHGRGFSEIARDFQRDPQNRRFGRRALRLRVSVSRMLELFSEVSGRAIPNPEPSSVER